LGWPRTVENSLESRRGFVTCQRAGSPARWARCEREHKPLDLTSDEYARGLDGDRTQDTEVGDKAKPCRRLKRFVKEWEEQIPRRLKPPRDDKIEGLAARLNRLRKESERRIPQRLKSLRDDKNKRLRRWPKGQLYPKASFSAECSEPEVLL
jgi:hypothetical protein